MSQRDTEQREVRFVPKGAIAFIAVMFLAYGAIWLLFYLLMVGRP